MDYVIKVLKNRELAGTIFVTTGSLLGSFFSYLLQFFLARYLIVEDYGEFNVLLSLAYIAGVPTTVLSTALIKRVSSLLSEQNWKKLTNLFISSFYLAVLIGLFMFLIIFGLKGYISATLKLSNITNLILFGIWLGVSFFLTVPNAFLLGLLRYKAYALFVSLASLTRFALPALFVLIGYGLTGTFVGLIISVLVAFSIAILLLKKNLGDIRKSSSNISQDLNEVFKFVMPVVMINLSMMLLNNVDLVLVKKFFDAETAGYYAGVVTLGKILLFGAGTITVVMFPKISSVKATGHKVIKDFRFYFGLQVLAVVFGILVFTMFPKLLTLILFGTKFFESIQYLPMFSVFVGFYVIINFLVMFLLAIDKSHVYMFLLPGVLAQYLLINAFHDTLFQIISINIYVTLTLLTIIGIYLFSTFKKDFRTIS